MMTCFSGIGSSFSPTPERSESAERAPNWATATRPTTTGCHWSSARAWRSCDRESGGGRGCQMRPRNAGAEIACHLVHFAARQDQVQNPPPELGWIPPSSHAVLLSEYQHDLQLSDSAKPPAYNGFHLRKPSICKLYFTACRLDSFAPPELGSCFAPPFSALTGSRTGGGRGHPAPTPGANPPPGLLEGRWWPDDLDRVRSGLARKLLGLDRHGAGMRLTGDHRNPDLREETLG